MKKALMVCSLGISLLLFGATALAGSPRDVQLTKSSSAYLGEVHSPMEHPGTWTSERKPWSAPTGSSNGDVNVDGLGFWWGGYYYETVTNTLIQNNVARDPAEAFKMLGRGVCMDTTESTSLTGTINIGGEARFSDAVKASFGFSGSGTRTFTQTYRYCGPSDTSQYRYRYFYKQLVYNKYQSAVIRIFYYWDGRWAGMESGTANVLVPYMAIFSEDTN